MVFIGAPRLALNLVSNASCTLGILIDGVRDNSGQMYMRNRY